MIIPLYYLIILMLLSLTEYQWHNPLWWLPGHTTHNNAVVSSSSSNVLPRTQAEILLQQIGYLHGKVSLMYMLLYKRFTIELI